MKYLFDPLGQQSGGENDRVGDGEYDKIAVRRDASGRLLHQYNERQRVADHTDDDDDWAQVDVQLLVQSVRFYVHHLTLVRLHVHRCVSPFISFLRCSRFKTYLFHKSFPPLSPSPFWIDPTDFMTISRLNFLSVYAFVFSFYPFLFDTCDRLS